MGDAERVGDVGGAIGRDHQREFPAQHLCQGFQVQVARWRFGPVLFLRTRRDFRLVLLGLDEFGPQHGDHLATCSRRLTAGFLSGSAKRAGHRPSRREHRLIHRLADRFDDHRLAGNQFSWRVTRVNRGNAKTADPGDQSILSVVGVDGPQRRLQRYRVLNLILIVLRVQEAG